MSVKSSTNHGAITPFILLRSAEGSVSPAARGQDGVEEGVASYFDTVETHLALHPPGLPNDRVPSPASPSLCRVQGPRPHRARPVWRGGTLGQGRATYDDGDHDTSAT